MCCPAFPEDLVAAQCAWYRTYRALADPAQSGRTTALRRRLLALSAQVWWHPYWRKAGAGHRLALRTHARELEREVR
ncbi:hypothetical protein [Streptomyces violaceusniger]|uniref:Uncharacterized protein n=1 Tax=Streptomyces violaceusniger (strain Tu 4113) TaxID=653045 RepID=G2PE89_STRV4|nr:hypothetical protein [Streptomyces violaceusniger]AEM83065.1 hypothetical protein Strvi_3387 [Streptomyces violaceusniger Tu 4113]